MYENRLKRLYELEKIVSDRLEADKRAFRIAAANMDDSEDLLAMLHREIKALSTKEQPNE